MLKNLFCFAVACLCLQLVIADVDFQQQCVDAHNKFRKLHEAADLIVDSSLIKVAQQWANHLLETGTFQHRPNNKLGENLYRSLGRSTITCGHAVKPWYDEIKDYDFNNPGYIKGTGHFTQVVWKNTKRVGCAKAQKGTSIYVVCNYDPPGNFLRQFGENVLRGGYTPEAEKEEDFHDNFYTVETVKKEGFHDNFWDNLI